MKLLGVVGAVVALFAAGPVNAAGEGDFIGHFNGAWSGSGTVIKGSMPWHVSCRVSGQPDRNRITIAGDCSVAIVDVRISADLTYDPATDSYSGTYIGAKVGPAHLFGKRTGNTVHLAITWPKPVNGDTKARMTIVNNGSSLRIVVTDNVTPGGPEEATSDLLLSQG
jgi:hypothetical protein